MHAAYGRALARCGLEAFAVEADTGAIGGSSSHEFMIAADVGEDAIVFCDDCGYAANVERAEGRPVPAPALAASEAVTVHTPAVGAIDEVVAYLNANGHAEVVAGHMLKTVLFVAETGAGAVTVAAYLRGDRSVNEVKLTNAISAALAASGAEHTEIHDLRAMSDDEVRAATGARPGFAGPGLTAQVQICDALVAATGGRWISGANQDDHHVVGLELDGAAYHVADISLAAAGDGCPRCAGTLAERRGIEAGHVFKLGTKYSAAMGAEFIGQDNKRHPLIMGCYGIGTSRVAAAAVEQHHDDNGIMWPMTIAPYQAVVVPVRADNAEQMAAAEELYRELRARGVEVILDDRDAKPGVKFKDWDLIGIPLRVVVGRGIGDGQIEVKWRDVPAEDQAVAGAAAALADAVHARAAALTG
jgi:prolyl-tRNA synthetase